MSSSGFNVLRILLLLILILALLFGGLLLLDWIGVLNARKDLSPLLQKIGISSPTDITQNPKDINTRGLISRSRLEKDTQSLNLQRLALEQKEQALTKKEQELKIKEDKINDLEKKLEEQQEVLNKTLNQYEDKTKRLEYLAQKFREMPPAQVVALLNQMEPLEVVDLLRTSDRLASLNKTNSLVGFWLSQMPPTRAAEINKLLIEKPN